MYHQEIVTKEITAKILPPKDYRRKRMDRSMNEGRIKKEDKKKQNKVSNRAKPDGCPAIDCHSLL